MSEAEMNEFPVEQREGPWRFVWHGGRTADVYHVEYPGKALDVVPVGPYSLTRGESEATPETMREAVTEWVRQYGEDYARNQLPYLT